MEKEKTQAFKHLNIKKKNKVILSLDGGGVRGILTLQLLKKLEEVAGIPCYQLFDLVAGASTGGIIAGLIACGKTASEIEELYLSLVKRVFKPRSLLAHRLLNPPAYTKKNFRSHLKDLVGAETTLEDACKRTGLDLLIVSRDVAAGEETFLSCFEQAGSYVGEYKDVLLRSAMEATMSVPIYFAPLERFVDGGITAYHNPALAAILEAVQYGPPDIYSIKNLTVFSFGTGCRLHSYSPGFVQDPEGSDSLFWLQWIMAESPDDASDFQTCLLRSKHLFPVLDFRRFQISLDAEAMKKLPDRDLSGVDEVEANRLWDLKNEDFAEMQLDNVKLSPLMKVIGDAMAERIVGLAREWGTPPFGKDLLVDGKEYLVTRKGDIKTIKAQMSDPAWLDHFEA